MRIRVALGIRPELTASARRGFWQEHRRYTPWSTRSWAWIRVELDDGINRCCIAAWANGSAFRGRWSATAFERVHPRRRRAARWRMLDLRLVATALHCADTRICRRMTLAHGSCDVRLGRAALLCFRVSCNGPSAIVMAALRRWMGRACEHASHRASRAAAPPPPILWPSRRSPRVFPRCRMQSAPQQAARSPGH